MARWRFMLLLIFLLNVVLPFSSASQNVTEAGAYAYGAGNIRDDQSGITILRILKTVGVALGVALVVTFIAPIIIYFLLCCIGFTCSGVRGGSYAAVRQSDYGDVEAGSCFSCAQSMGACGSMGRNVLIGLVFGILSGAIAGYYAWFYFL